VPLMQKCWQCPNSTPRGVHGGPHCACPHLTEREMAVLCQVAAGHSNGEIAKVLNLSVHTVVRYPSSMLRKTGEHNRTALVNRAYGVGVLRMGDDGPQATGRRCVQT